MRNINNNIKVVFSDVDGVWTNGGMFYNEAGDYLRLFNTRDSGGVLLLNFLNIELCIISGEKSNAVKKRFEKLNIKNVNLGIDNKLNFAINFCKKKNIELSQTAFIGDDWNDYQLLREVGISACPIDADEYISSICNMKLKKKGGDGVFREFIKELINSYDKYDDIIKEYIAFKHKNE
ncbi:MAG: HAD hydrolase family protein [Leptospira sp.]|nr:HAD hydrolase family protein [Leptospira sp.]